MGSIGQTVRCQNRFSAACKKQLCLESFSVFGCHSRTVVGRLEFGNGIPKDPVVRLPNKISAFDFPGFSLKGGRSGVDFKLHLQGEAEKEPYMSLQ
jgi:hypothetical protein